jgi:predicted nucleic acid-binding protein
VNRVWFFYLDASATTKRYTREAGTPLVNSLFNRVPAARLHVLNVGIAEVVSVLVRKRNTSQLTPVRFGQALIELHAELVHSTSLNILETTNALVISALPLIETHSINGTDAIILRSALNLASSLRLGGEDLVLVASDQRLLRAAQAAGLKTFDPETQTQTDLDALLPP